ETGVRKVSTVIGSSARGSDGRTRWYGGGHLSLSRGHDTPSANSHQALKPPGPNHLRRHRWATVGIPAPVIPKRRLWPPHSKSTAARFGGLSLLARWLWP